MCRSRNASGADAKSLGRTLNSGRAGADVRAVDCAQLVLGRLLVGAIGLRRAASRHEGQALIEYALIITLIAVVAIGVLQTTGVNIKGLLNRIAGEV